MQKRVVPSQSDIDFTDFAHAQRDEQVETRVADGAMEETPPDIREAVADGLDQVRKGRFADGKVVEAILRRAGA